MVRFRIYYKIAVVLLFVLIISCSTQQVLLDHRDFHPNQTVNIKTRDGEQISGIVTHANADAVLLRDTTGKQRGFLTKNIVSATGPNPVLNDNGIIVSEAEIDSIQTATHVTTFAIVGGFMSGGVSYLFSRMINNEILKSHRDAPLYIATVTGVSLGTILFARAGDRKDREKAIENVLTARTDLKYNISLPDLEDDKYLKEKIDEIMKDRQEKEKEIQQLNNELESQEPVPETKTP